MSSPSGEHSPRAPSPLSPMQQRQATPPPSLSTPLLPSPQLSSPQTQSKVATERTALSPMANQPVQSMPAIPAHAQTDADRPSFPAIPPRSPSVATNHTVSVHADAPQQRRLSGSVVAPSQLDQQGPQRSRSNSQTLAINHDPSVPAPMAQENSGVSRLRKAAHGLDMTAALTSAPYASGRTGAVIQGVSGLAWAASGITSGIDNAGPQGQRPGLVADVSSTLAGMADVGSAVLSQTLPDAHLARQIVGQSGNALWGVSGLTSMVTSTYQTVQDYRGGASFRWSNAANFVSGGFNALGAALSGAATEYALQSDPQSQVMATGYGSGAMASWVLGAGFGMLGTYLSQREQPPQRQGYESLA